MTSPSPSPIDIGSSVIEIDSVRVPARSGIVEEIVRDEKGNVHAFVVDKGSKDVIDYFWSPVLQLRNLDPIPVKTMNIVELGEILKEKNLSAKITYRDGYFRVKLKCQKSYKTSYFDSHESITEAINSALAIAEREREKDKKWTLKQT